MKLHCLKALALWLAFMMMVTSTGVFADDRECFSPERKPHCIDVCDIVIRSLGAVNTIVGDLNDVFATQGSVSQIGPISNADPFINPVIDELFSAELRSIRQAGAEVESILKELEVKHKLIKKIVRTISLIVENLFTYSRAVNVEAPLSRQQAILNALFREAEMLGKLLAETTPLIHKKQMIELTTRLVQDQTMTVRAFKGVLEDVPPDQQTARAVELDQQSHQTTSRIATIVATKLAKGINQNCRK